jgi:hypothetical protein
MKKTNTLAALCLLSTLALSPSAAAQILDPDDVGEVNATLSYTPSSQLELVGEVVGTPAGASLSFEATAQPMSWLTLRGASTLLEAPEDGLPEDALETPGALAVAAAELGAAQGAFAGALLRSADGYVDLSGGFRAGPFELEAMVSPLSSLPFRLTISASF